MADLGFGGGGGQHGDLEGGRQLDGALEAGRPNSHQPDKTGAMNSTARCVTARAAARKAECDEWTTWVANSYASAVWRLDELVTTSAVRNIVSCRLSMMSYGTATVTSNALLASMIYKLTVCTGIFPWF